MDDAPNVLRSLRREFQREQYEVDTASSSNEALALLAQQEFHILISDYMMPGLNGAELLKRA